MKALRFSINGRQVVEERVSPTTTLLNYLREQLGMTGTKEGCAEGDCGACTVAIVDPKTKTFKAVNACLILLPMIQGKEVITVEGLKDANGYHPVQQRLVELLGSQCGYCTPGVIMSMFEACYRDDLDEAWKIDDQMCGNLCRCTGYRPIRQATQDVAGKRPRDRFLKLLEAPKSEGMGLSYSYESQRFYTPGSFDELWSVLEREPHARFVVGGTDLSLEVTKQFKQPGVLVSLEGIEALHQLDFQSETFELGACATLSELETQTQKHLPPVERILRFFGSRQIKNRGTIGGNLCNASPIGDLAPVFLSLGAKLSLRSKAGTRVVPIEDFFLDYRKTALLPGEILASVLVPKLKGDLRAVAYKVSKRQELDISAVAAGLYVELEGGVVKVARFGFGGMAKTPARASGAEAAVIGQPWTEATVEAAMAALGEDFSPIDDHRGSAWYRRTVAANFLRGFFFETQTDPVPRLSYRPTGTIGLGAVQEVSFD